jgi:hypothetical protein
MGRTCGEREEKGMASGAGRRASQDEAELGLLQRNREEEEVREWAGNGPRPGLDMGKKKKKDGRVLKLG